MSVNLRSHVFDAPFHVRVDKGGTIRMFLPDGSSVCLSEEAALASLRELSRAVRARPVARWAGNVIAVDFRLP